MVASERISSVTAIQDSCNSVLQRNGEHIFCGARGGTVETVDGKSVSYGLDKDSNAGCSIDNLT